MNNSAWPWLPPWPPAPPEVDEGDVEYFRTWHPLQHEFPVDADNDGLFEITCGASVCDAEAADGLGPLVVFEGPLVQTLELARDLARAGAFDGTLCPWECEPGVVSHHLSPDEVLSFAAGHGFAGLAFEGTEAADDGRGRGFSNWAHAEAATVGSHRLRAHTMRRGLQWTACRALVDFNAWLRGSLKLDHR